VLIDLEDDLYSQDDLIQEFQVRLCEGVKHPRQRASEFFRFSALIGFLTQRHGYFEINRSIQSESGEMLSQPVIIECLNFVVDSYQKRWYATRERSQDKGRKLHGLFCHRHPHYRMMYDILTNHLRQGNGRSPGLTNSEIQEIANKPWFQTGENLKLSRGIEILGDWGEYFGVLTTNRLFAKSYPTSNEAKHLYLDDRYYVITGHRVAIEEFQDILEKMYHELKMKFSPFFLRSDFVDITLLREYVCEELKIHRETFDDQLVQLWSDNLLRYELVRPPWRSDDLKSITSVFQLRSPSDRPGFILKASRKARRKGLPSLRIGNYDYFYIRISE